MSNLIRINSSADVVLELQNVLASLQLIEGYTDGLEGQITNVISELTTLNGNDFATEATLGTISSTLTTISNAVADLDGNTDQIESKLDDIITALGTLNAVDFATEAKQDDIITALGTLNANDFATEAKQDDIISELQALNLVDFATGSDIAGLKPFGANAAGSTVAQGTSSVLLLAANADRKEVMIKNQAQGNNHILYISYVSPATAANASIDLSKGDVWLEDKFTGNIYGIWSNAGSGTAIITEVTL